MFFISLEMFVLQKITRPAQSTFRFPHSNFHVHSPPKSLFFLYYYFHPFAPSKQNREFFCVSVLHFLALRFQKWLSRCYQRWVPVVRSSTSHFPWSCLVKRGFSAGRGNDLEDGGTDHHEEEQRQHDRADGEALPGFLPRGHDGVAPLLDAVFIVLVGHSRPSCVSHVGGGERKELLPKTEFPNYEFSYVSR